MAVTLNYTSKGLIDAIQRQLAQQKKEGKISGDISYKNIVTCDFWSTLKEINNKRDKKNKIYHQKDYGCDDKGKPVDWKKTIVVYGSTKLEDDEWEMLVNAMKQLQITGKKEEKAEPVVTEPAVTEPTVTEPVVAEPTNKYKVVIDDQMPDKNIPIGALSASLTELQEQGLTDTEAAHVMQKAMDLEYKFVADKNAENNVVAITNQGDTVSLSHVREVVEINDLKAEAAKQAGAKNTECTEELEEECSEENSEQ